LSSGFSYDKGDRKKLTVKEKNKIEDNRSGAARRRGRPRKVHAWDAEDISKEKLIQAEKEVLDLIRHYSEMKLEADRIAESNPTLLSVVGIDPNARCSESEVTYDHALAEKLPGYDRCLVESYVYDVEMIHFLEEAVDELEDERLRSVAREVFLERWPCESIAEFYYVREREMYYLRKEALDNIAVKWIRRKEFNCS